MPINHFLIADDVDDDKIGRMRSVVEMNPHNQVHIARSAREALSIIGTIGPEISGAAIDFDFLGEPETGADIIAALRNSNANAAIACVTARNGSSFKDAERMTLSAGANAAFTSSQSFESELRLVLAA